MTVTMGTNDQRVNLVFEGGGVKGIALAGAFAKLDRRGFKMIPIQPAPPPTAPAA